MQKKSNKSGRRGYRRPWWKKLFRRGSSEDMLEYVSRMAAVPLLVLSLILVYGLTVEPSERRSYIEALTSPVQWFGSLFADREDVADAGQGRDGGTMQAAPVRYEPVVSGLDSVASVGAGSDSMAPDSVSSDSLTAAPTETPAVEGTWYVVKRGETLRDIARAQYGDAAQWKRVWFYNLERLPKANSVRYGLELFIPPPGELTDEENRRVNELMGQ